MILRLSLAAGLLTLSLSGEIGNIRVLGTTAIQAIISYVAPGPEACSVEVYESFGPRGDLLITAAGSGSPIKITTDVPHGLRSGKKVNIQGVAGNNAANGYFTITVTDIGSSGLSSNFTLDDSSASGAYTGGGRVWYLVDDLDTALFPGADQDSRAGNITSGRARWFVVGKRATGKVGSTFYSRALQAYTDHHVRIRCGSETAIGEFRTTTVPSGHTYENTFRTDPDVPGASAWPTLQGTSRMEWVIDPYTGVKVRPISRSREYGTGGGTSYYGAAICANTTVEASDHKWGYHCLVGQGDSYHQTNLYWIERGGKSIRYLGKLGYYYNTVWSSPTPNGTQDCHGGMVSTEPNTFYCVYNGPSILDDQIYVIKGTYNGHQTGQDQDRYGLPENASYVNATWERITPPAAHLRALAEAFDPRFADFHPKDTADTHSYTRYWGIGVQDGKLVIDIARNGGDSPGWYIVFDPEKIGSDPGCVGGGQKGCVVAMMSTYLGEATAPNRWCGNHGITTRQTIGTWLSPTINPIGGDGPYSMPVTHVNDNPTPYSISTSTGVDCPAWSPGSPIPEPDWPNPLTNRCLKVRVASLTPAAAADPATLGTDLMPGDLVGFVLDSNRRLGYSTEALRVLTIDNQAGELYLQRNVNGSKYAASVTTLYAGCAALNGNINSGGFAWWNWATDPLATNLKYNVLTRIGGHRDIGATTWGWKYIGVSPDYQLGVNTTPLPELLDQAPASIPSFTLFPKFASKQLYAGGSSYLESHVKYRQYPGEQAETRWVADGRIYLGDINSVQAGNVVYVSGDLYKVTGTGFAAAYKHIPVVAHSNGKVLADISGPSSGILDTAADNFKLCVALRAGECRTGSAAGDIYINAPGVTTYRYCRSVRSVSPAPDICVTQQLSVTQSIVQLDLVKPDSVGRNIRLITHALMPIESTIGAAYTYYSGSSTPDAVMIADGYIPGNSTYQVLLADQPPWPAGDSVNRTTFVPLQIDAGTVTPGTDNVIAEFGYDTDLRCTKRAETCVSTTGAARGNPVPGIDEVTPFALPSLDPAVTGVPCSSGCTLVIPAIPQRVVYYRIQYRAGANVVFIGAVQVATTP